MSDIIGFVCCVGLAIGVLAVASAVSDVVYFDGKRDGRCVELCKPDRLYDVTPDGDGFACQCHGKRVVLP